MIQHFGFEPMIFCPHQTVRVRAVADDDANDGVEPLFLDRVDDRLKIGPAAGDEHA
jgi:hypothetical protein